MEEADEIDLARQMKQAEIKIKQAERQAAEQAEQKESLGITTKKSRKKG